MIKEDNFKNMLYDKGKNGRSNKYFIGKNLSSFLCG